MWLPAFLLALLLLAYPQAQAQNLSPCLVAQASRPQISRPIVRARSHKWKTILALDGGDMRATIQTAVLCEVEQAIKRALVSKGLTKYKNIEEFDILLSDYFDVMAGSSAGSYVSSYLGTDGADAGMAIPSITAVPGSALGSYEFMQSFANLVRDSTAALPPANSTNYAIVGSALYQIFDKYFAAIYGNRTLQGPYPDRNKASLLYTWSRIGAGLPEGTSETGMGAITVFRDNKAKKGGLLFPNVNGTEAVKYQQNFYLWQGIRGTTSWPPRVPAYIATTTPDSSEQATYAIADGAITAMDPAVVALPYVITHQKAQLNRVAILSIGTGSVINETVGGTTFPVASVDWISGAQNSGIAWSSTLANRYRSVNIIQQLYNTMSKSRYLRIDQEFTVTPEGAYDCAGVFTGSNCSTVVEAIKLTYYGNLPTYTYIGATWANLYADKINAFVSKYLTA